MANFHQWFVLTSIILSIAYILTRRRSKLPPGPKPLPIVGNLLLLGDNPHRSLATLAKTYGAVMTLKLGQVTTIVVSSPSVAREVLLKNDQAFCGRSINDAIHVHHHHESSMAWIPPNQLWKSLRKICGAQLLSSQRLDASRGIREAKARYLADYLRTQGSTGEAINVGRVVFTTILNTLSSTLFSTDMVDSYSEESAQEFRELMRGIMVEVGSPNVSDFFPMLRGLDLQGNRRRSEKCFGRFHEIFDQLIDKRLQERTGGKAVSTAGAAKDFLDMLLDILVEGKIIEFDRVALKCLLLDILVAGVDTSASTVEWVMAELLHNPTSMAKARAELANALGKNTKIDESDILQLPYLQAVVKETLRLHPPIPFLLPRSTLTSVDLCGYAIPARTRVLVNCWAIGRDENIWTEDAEKFVPERFLGKDVDYKGRDFELIPFGAGRRICPGLPLAFRMVHLMLASMLHSFDWELPNGKKAEDVDMTDKFGITLVMAVPLRAIPVPDSM